VKSQALQELVKKIFSDEKTKYQFLKDPDSVIAQFNLTEQEKKAVLSTHAKLGLVTADSQQLEAVLDSTINWTAPTP
jgi:thiamine biosynthesis lipoprotein ApbE